MNHELAKQLKDAGFPLSYYKVTNNIGLLYYCDGFEFQP